MITTEKQNEILERIISSQTFASSNINKDLLSYLVKTSQEGRSPKEVNIATEVLGRADGFDPSGDPYVRSSVYNLRKRLARYYEKEGADEAIKLVIPKGSYRIDFLKKQAEFRGRTKSNANRVISILLALSILANIGLLFSLLFKSQSVPAASTHLWKDFTSNKIPTLLVVGDFMTFEEYDADQGVMRSIRDHRINTLEQFERMARQYPKRRLRIEKDYRSFEWNGVENYLALGNVFNGSVKNVFVKRASKLQWEDIQNNNIIFQGSQLSLFLLGRYLQMTHFRTNIEDENARDNLYQISDAGDTIAVYSSVGNPGADSEMEGYVLLAKLPGPNKNNILIIVGSLEMSRSLLVQQLTDLVYLKQLDDHFKKELNEIPDHFEVLLKTKGFPRTGVSQEIIYLGKL